ncbi:MAG: Ku protein [Xanthobacteraceae bacterium]
MAPRANWKGYLRLSLVSCPIALYPATSEREKIRFHQINRNTGNRIKLLRVDAETGEPVEYEDIVKGYEVGKGEYIEITDEELEAIALESTRTIEIDQFVPRDEIDDLYNVRPYYIAPDGNVGQDAFAVIRDVIGAMKMVALGRVVLTSREHVMAIEPRDTGLAGTLLRYPYEVRQPAEFFEDIPATKVTKDMLDLAKHIVETKSGHFDPEKFEDQYENALKELLRKKQAGEKIAPAAQPQPAKVINLMDALRKSLETERGAATRAKPKAATSSRQRAPAKAAAKPKRARRAG